LSKHHADDDHLEAPHVLDIDDLLADDETARTMLKYHLGTSNKINNLLADDEARQYAGEGIFFLVWRLRVNIINLVMAFLINIISVV